MKKIRGKFCALLILALVLSSAAVGFAATGQQKIDASYNNIKISVNGTTVTPKDAAGNTVEPFIYNGTTYLPVRAVSSMLGNEVSWDNATKTVSITAGGGSQGTLIDSLSELWTLYAVAEGVEEIAQFANNIYASEALQTTESINSVFSLIDNQKSWITDITSQPGALHPYAKERYAKCEKMLDLTYDNLKKFKNGATAYDSFKAEKGNVSATATLKGEIGTTIFNTFKYAN